ncbi:SusD/RagB family nutrient-binding outer membrane lipoprotein [Flavihumibacter profundi]|uniref:SusD/RagB family nutrient-binding outer membrane lipoprotein n=1 Tax=Flavihumibacter profundi TaxID=2716883 RepID=UPI001CC5A56D|nr:SusD/RagB family nutrient-binding outer membrane lipoprotein [Flavihumibacter profundi]MBZ5858883.1 SusD/RagB family nutrient-binding outer membrane lipoprotein [Flavihumibacter profundi]
MNILQYKKLLFGVTLGTMMFSVSCTKDFGEINTNPSTVTNPDVKFLLTYSEDQLATYQGTEWVWESMEQLFRFTQHFTSSPYELTSNANSRYNAYYSNILPNLFEIRRQIDLKTDKEDYAKMAAVTYIIQVLHGIKVTDMNGSIPYSEAIKGRYEGKYDPVFDTQEQLFTTWLSELNSAIGTLSAASTATEKSYGNSDVYYKSDWTKWVKLANTLKLRIAARYENQDAAKTTAIVQEVLANSVGPITTVEEQLMYSNPNYEPIGGAINYRDIKYGTISLVDFMKKVNDPRIGVYFNPNDLVGSFKDTLTKYGATLPDFIDINDPLIQFQGGPVDWTINAPQTNYFKNAFVVSPENKYFLISTINRKFFAPRYDGTTTGTYTELLAGAGESCLLLAEFIKKGYGSGDYKEWYKKGVEASIRSMNAIAKVAGSTTPYSGSGATEIANYLAGPEVALGAENDLERIYVQQYLNLVRQPNEAYVFSRRTGYPKYNSEYYTREVFNEPIPRRFWINDPGEVNRANWSAAYAEQGFTPNVQDALTLSKERVWYDKTAPEFGKGN